MVRKRRVRPRPRCSPFKLKWCRSLRGPFRQKNAAPATAGAGCGIEASSWLIKAGANWFCKEALEQVAKTLGKAIRPRPLRKIAPKKWKSSGRMLPESTGRQLQSIHGARQLRDRDVVPKR